MNVTENGHLPIQAGEVLWTGERKSRVFGVALTFAIGAIAAFLAVAALAACARN